MWRGALWCGMARCAVVRNDAVWRGALWCEAMRYGAVWCGAVWCGAVRCGAVWCGAVRCGAVRCGAVPSWTGIRRLAERIPLCPTCESSEDRTAWLFMAAESAALSTPSTIAASAEEFVPAAARICICSTTLPPLSVSLMSEGCTPYNAASRAFISSMSTWRNQRR